MKSIFSLLIILTFAVSSVCMTGCSGPDDSADTTTTTTTETSTDAEPAASGDKTEDKAPEVKTEGGGSGTH